MFKKFFLTYLFIIPISSTCGSHVNIIGFINDTISLSRHASSFITCLQNKISCTLIKSRKTNTQDIPEHLKKINNNSIDITQALKNNYTLTGLTIFTDGLSISWKEYLSLPNKSTVKILYAAIERSVIPESIVAKMNANFDAIAVPDPWMIDTFKQSGVDIPIFILPLVLDQNLESLLELPIKKLPNKPFVFGMTGVFTPRKNHSVILKAFAEEFGNNPNFKLRLHGSGGKSVSELFAIKKKYKLSNVEIIHKKYSRQEYEDFIRSLDCYSFVSKGEGFSITPREAMAAGVPCILSNNTAHNVICKSGFVCPVPSNIIEPSYYEPLKKYVGTEFNCDIHDVRKAMRDVYKNYKDYQVLVPQAREWVKQYLAKNLASRYVNLVAPKLVIIGPDNLITDTYLMTNSEKLYKKFQNLLSSKS